MTNPVRRTATLSPSPRHMRRRRFRGDVPPSLLPEHKQVMKAERSSSTSAAVTPAAPLPKTGVSTQSAPVARDSEPKETSLRRKRLVALAVVTLVSLSIPILALTLMFGR